MRRGVLLALAVGLAGWMAAGCSGNGDPAPGAPEGLVGGSPDSANELVSRIAQELPLEGDVTGIMELIDTTDEGGRRG